MFHYLEFNLVFKTVLNVEFVVLTSLAGGFASAKFKSVTNYPLPPHFLCRSNIEPSRCGWFGNLYAFGKVTGIKTVSDTDISIPPLANKHGGALSADVVPSYRVGLERYRHGAPGETIEKNASF